MEKEKFKNPPASYRAIPFWAWNCKLEQAELERQLCIFKEMGMGGAMIHARNGLETPYMQDEFMCLVQACIQKAKQEDLYIWLYDEDRWPSGDAGHQVTQNPRYKIRVVKVSAEVIPYVPKEEALQNGGTYLLGIYSISRNPAGELLSYRRVEDSNADPSETVIYAYCQCIPGSSYVDTLSKEAIDCFIRLTHQRYFDLCGEDFSKTVPSIFTDEPQFARKEWLNSGLDNGPVCMPWTYDLPETYAQAYGADILDTLPELFWDLAAGTISVARYRYHDHVTKRFTEAFAENLGRWCGAHHVALSGHMMAEQALWTQTALVGEAMRAYGSFQIPGVDMLCDWREYTTVLQARSSAHQYGRKDVLSELYGVTNWDFDFRGHKLQGDWQAALGVTIRVPHLAWVSMHGDAKRDYPASINYQSPWYSKYTLIEDHFSRVNLAMTEGTPVVNVAVIHPVESYWLHWGPKEGNAHVQASMERNFQQLTDWLLFGSVDFDFIAESTLPELYRPSEDGFAVGQMTYKTVLVSGCETLRRTTVEILLDYVRRGGTVWFAGTLPTLVDAVPDDGLAVSLFAHSAKIPMEQQSLLQAMQPYQQVRIVREDGIQTNEFLYNLRQIQQDYWLFVAHGRKLSDSDCVDSKSVRIQVRGVFKPELYDTQTGQIDSISYTHVKDEAGNVWTQIVAVLFAQDSLLLRLNKTECVKQLALDPYNPWKMNAKPCSICEVESPCAYTLSEPNVLLLDIAEYAWDDAPVQPAEELLRIDEQLHKALWPERGNRGACQPYMLPEELYEHTLYLRMTFQSEIAIDRCCLALEEAERTKICLNGAQVSGEITGYFTDRSIQTVLLPSIRKGTNVLELTLPVRYKSCVEWCYLLGDFGVRIEGTNKILTDQPKHLTFDSLTNQGHPFYGANVTYETHFTVPGQEDERFDVLIRVPSYGGTLVSCVVDECIRGDIIYAPYCMKISGVSAGRHTLSLTCYGNRFNSFGQLHLKDEKCIWFGPASWRTQGDAWTYSYQVKDTGFLKPPVVEVYDSLQTRTGVFG